MSRYLRPASRLFSAAAARPTATRSVFRASTASRAAGLAQNRSYASEGGSKEYTVRDALNEALAEELELNPKVFVLGEEVAQYSEYIFSICYIGAPLEQTNPLEDIFREAVLGEYAVSPLQSTRISSDVTSSLPEMIHANCSTDGAYKVTKGLLDRFGDKRVIDSPITESGFCGLTVGAALAGLHPVVRISLPHMPKEDSAEAYTTHSANS